MNIKEYNNVYSPLACKLYYICMPRNYVYKILAVACGCTYNVYIKTYVLKVV